MALLIGQHLDADLSKCILNIEAVSPWVHAEELKNMVEYELAAKEPSRLSLPRNDYCGGNLPGLMEKVSYLEEPYLEP